MTSLADFLMRNRLDALEEKPEYTTADVNALMPTPSWKSPLAGLGSYQLSQEAGAEPNWFGRNVLSNIPPEAMHAANFLIPGKVPRLPNPIKAYHGSPHDFDKFDLSKIGTGEGAQAYGHGLYFAEREGVARTYRNDTSASKHPVGTPERAATEALSTANGDEKIAAIILRQQASENAGHWSADLFTRGADLLETGKFKPPGKMYEVALHATPEQFLDWDKPLAAQSPQVRDAVGSVYRTAQERSGYKVPLLEHVPASEHMQSLNNALSQSAAQPGRADMFQFYKRQGEGQRGSSGALREAGIPGIRYLDQGSRGSGSGTSNYVVWSPEIIEILRKYGLAPAIAAPSLASVLQDQQSQ